MGVTIALKRKFQTCSRQFDLIGETMDDAQRREAEMELAEMQRTLDGLDAASASVDLMNSSYPAKLLGFECSEALSNSILTTLVSFFSFILARLGAGSIPGAAVVTAAA